MRRSFVFAGLLTVALAGPAGAGGLGKGAKVTLDSISVRAKGQPPAEAKAGDVLQTEVVSPNKLAGFGLDGVQAGDAIEVKVLEAGKRFEVKHGATGRTVVLVAGDDGALKIAPAAAVKAAPQIRTKQDLAGRTVQPEPAPPPPPPEDRPAHKR